MTWDSATQIPQAADLGGLKASTGTIPDKLHALAGEAFVGRILLECVVRFRG